MYLANICNEFVSNRSQEHFLLLRFKVKMNMSIREFELSQERYSFKRETIKYSPYRG